MEKITDRVRITGLLQQLIDKRALLTVTIEGREQPFNSALIELDPDAGHLMLDEMKPEEGTKLLKEGGSLQVNAQLQGVSIAFVARVDEIGRQDGIPFYKAPIPARLDYHQRRETARVRLSAANPVPVTFTTPEGETLDGELEDLSQGGLRAKFRKTLPEALDMGQPLGCSFSLPPNMEEMNCDVIIRIIKHKADRLKPAFLGGQFVDLNPTQEKGLQKAIMYLQRASQRKKGL